MGHIKWDPKKIEKPWSDFPRVGRRYLACESAVEGAMTTAHFAAGSHVMAPGSLSLGVVRDRAEID